jgi:hypothetical protein
MVAPDQIGAGPDRSGSQPRKIEVASTRREGSDERALTPTLPSALRSYATSFFNPSTIRLGMGFESSVR